MADDRTDGKDRGVVWATGSLPGKLSAQTRICADLLLESLDLQGCGEGWGERNRSQNQELTLKPSSSQRQLSRPPYHRVFFDPIIETRYLIYQCSGDVPYPLPQSMALHQVCDIEGVGSYSSIRACIRKVFQLTYCTTSNDTDTGTSMLENVPAPRT